jgi:uncharacterized membrane protein
MSYFTFFKNFFLSGLYIILPISISIYIIKIGLSFLSSFVSFLQINFNFLSFYQIKYSELISIFLIILIIGAIAKYTKLEHSIYTIENKIIQKIPIFKTIYNGIKKLTNIIKKEKAINSQTHQVAWVKLPKLNVYSLGLIIGELEKKYCPDEKKYYSIFLPTTPNPMTGYYIIAAESEFIINTMSREEAISIIISGGIIRPE